RHRTRYGVGSTNGSLRFGHERTAMRNRENPAGSDRLRMCVGLLAAAGLAFAMPALGQPNQEKAQERDPFALKPSTARELPSILGRDAQGKVVWIEGDPSRKVIELLDVSIDERRTMEGLLAERDEQLLQAAVPNTDKIIDLLEHH